MTDDDAEVWAAFWEPLGINPTDLAGVLKVRRVWEAREPILTEAESAYGSLEEVPRHIESLRQLILGEPPEVIVTLLRNGSVEVAEWSGRWHGAFPFVPHRRNKGAIIVVEPATHLEDVITAFKAIRTVRRRKFRRCTFCREMTPPEHYLAEYRCCHSCGSEDHGIVF